jgi:hypothetical protein
MVLVFLVFVVPVSAGLKPFAQEAVRFEDICSGSKPINHPDIVVPRYFHLQDSVAAVWRRNHPLECCVRGPLQYN